MPEVIVAGAGVVGLTAAIRLREAGSRRTSSPAIRRPPRRRRSRRRSGTRTAPSRASASAAWSARGFEVLSALAGTPGSGVRMRWGTELVAPGAEDPWWRAAVPTFARTPEGFRFEAPVADMSVHLPWLVARLRRSAARWRSRRSRSLDDALARAPVVVNCAGLGARELAGDGVAARRPRADPASSSRPASTSGCSTRPTPSGCCTSSPASATSCSAARRRSTTRTCFPTPRRRPRSAPAARRRCPRCGARGSCARRSACGPRGPPCASRRRPAPAGTIVHCYGHGGAGVTLAWGCAEEVTALVRRTLG